MILIKCQTGDHVVIQADSLEGANLSSLNLHRALLDRQSLRGATLVGADLRSAWLEGADLSDCDLSRVILFAAVCIGTSFSHACLRDAVLATGKFDRADFSWANLHGARLGQASLRGANLIGTDMRCLNLDKTDLAGAYADASTQWPDGFSPQAYGVTIRGTVA
jgi:uncharacterized protein YjbI with pentapeptide repeats